MVTVLQKQLRHQWHLQWLCMSALLLTVFTLSSAELPSIILHLMQLRDVRCT